MTTCVHFMHPPKLYKFDEGIMIIFVSGKNRPLLLAKGGVVNCIGNYEKK